MQSETFYFLSARGSMVGMQSLFEGACGEVAGGVWRLLRSFEWPNLLSLRQLSVRRKVKN